VDSFVVAAVSIGLFALPIVGARWSYVVSLVLAGLIGLYGICAVVPHLLDYGTNSDLGIALGGVLLVIAAVVATLAWVFRRRAIRKASNPWS
jgi:hypothetical protein